MTLNNKSILLAVLLLGSLATADTFKNKETGDTFDGFATQKTARDQTRVFNADKDAMESIVLDDYEVSYNTKGRTDRAIVIQVTNPDILLSEKIAMQVAKGIIDASNKGPQVIIVQLDTPGGRAEYMKHIASAILETKNCPVAAYISGGETGGAFATAAVLAMACEKVYIARNAVLGSVGPAPSNLDEQAYTDYLKTFAPESLSSPYMLSYLKTLAQQRDRPELLVRGLVDKTVSVVEVVDTSGKRQFIKREDLSPAQTIVRTLCEGLSQTIGQATISPSDLAGAVLTLTSDEAIQMGLAAGTANDIKDILTAYEVPDARLAKLPGIDKMINQFNAARRNISQALSQIEYLEEQTNNLESQFNTLDQQLATATQTRQTTQGGRIYSSGNRSRTTLPSDWTGYNLGYGNFNQYQQGRSTSMRTNPNRTTVITQEPIVDITVLQQRFAQSLQLLIGEYRRAANLAKRWPGALPPEVTPAMLEENAASAQRDLARLIQYQPIYQIQQNYNQNQGYVPGNNRGRR